MAFAGIWAHLTVTPMDLTQMYLTVGRYRTVIDEPDESARHLPDSARQHFKRDRPGQADD